MRKIHLQVELMLLVSHSHSHVKLPVSSTVRTYLHTIPIPTFNYCDVVSIKPELPKVNMNIEQFAIATSFLLDMKYQE